jgi:ribose transport system permease protein
VSTDIVTKPDSTGFATGLQTIGRRATLAQLAVVIGIVAELALFASMNSAFFTSANLISIVQQTSTIGIIAVAQGMLIISGGIDVSVGSVVGLSGMSCALLIRQGFPTPVAIAGGLASGVVAGIINGTLISRFGLDPFITTLATLGAFRGITYVISNQNGVNVAGAPGISVLGKGTALGVPISVWIFVVVIVVFLLVERRTTLGRKVYAVGLSPRAAAQSGIDPSRVRMIIFAATGLCAAISGILIVSQIGIAVAYQGTGTELDVIAAVVVGGISLSGGRGSVFQAVLGALFLGILVNGFAINNVPDFWQQVAKGVAILVAVGLANSRNKRG